MTGDRSGGSSRRLSRRDVLGWAGVGLGTTLAGAALGRRALDGPGRVPERVPEETIRIGRGWRGTPGTLTVGGDRHGTDDIPEDEGVETWWLRTDLRPSGDGQPVTVWFREGTCVEVEDRTGPFADVEGVLSDLGDLLLGWQKRVRVQVPTGGTGPPVANPPGGPGPSSVRNRDDDRFSDRGRPRGTDAPYDVAGLLHLGWFQAELARRFDGAVPVVAGPGVFDAQFYPRWADGGYPVDEDDTCKRPARDGEE